MKTADIKIGESYKVGYYGRGRVLETRVERSTWRSSKSRKDGVKVFFEEGYREGQEMIVSSREVDELWEDYQARRDAAELQRKISEQDRERMEEKAKQLSSVLSSLGVEAAEASASYVWGDQTESYRASLELPEESLDRLLSLLDAPEARKQAEAVSTATSDPLAELLG